MQGTPELNLFEPVFVIAMGGSKCGQAWSGIQILRVCMHQGYLNGRQQPWLLPTTVVNPGHNTHLGERPVLAPDSVASAAVLTMCVLGS